MNGWGGVLDFARLMLSLNSVEIEVEVGVELVNILTPR